MHAEPAPLGAPAAPRGDGALQELAAPRGIARWALRPSSRVVAEVSPAAQEAPEAPPQGSAPRPRRKKPLPRRQVSELLPREPFCLEHEVSKEPRPVARVSRRPEPSRESALERNVVALDPVDLVDLTQGLGNSFAPSVSSGRAEQLHVSHETFHPSYPSRELQVQEDVDHSASLGTDAPPVVPTNTFPSIDPAIVEHTSTSPGIVQDPAAAPVSGSAPAVIQDPAAQGARSMSSAGDEDLRPERPEPSMALEPEDVRDILEQLQEESSEAEEESEEARTL